MQIIKMGDAFLKIYTEDGIVKMKEVTEKEYVDQGDDIIIEDQSPMMGEIGKTVEKIRDSVLSRLEDQLEKVVAMALGFKVDHWNGWEVDHCNGRMSDLRRYIEKDAADMIKSMGLNPDIKFSNKEISEMENSIKDNYKNRYKEELRREVNRQYDIRIKQHAESIVDGLMENIAEKQIENMVVDVLQGKQKIVKDDERR